MQFIKGLAKKNANAKGVDVAVSAVVKVMAVGANIDVMTIAAMTKTTKIVIERMVRARFLQNSFSNLGSFDLENSLIGDPSSALLIVIRSLRRRCV